MVWEIHPSQIGRVKILVRRLCSCFDRGNCILLDDGEPHKCVQLISCSGVYCNYFKNAVLPADKELYRQIRNYNKNEKCKMYSADVFIAAGFPLTWVSGQKEEFRQYLLQNETVDFTFRGKEYHMTSL